jgi:hypothetical protein
MVPTFQIFLRVRTLRGQRLVKEFLIKVGRQEMTDGMASLVTNLQRFVEAVKLASQIRVQRKSAHRVPLLIMTIDGCARIHLIAPYWHAKSELLNPPELPFQLLPAKE